MTNSREKKVKEGLPTHIRYEGEVYVRVSFLMKEMRDFEHVSFGEATLPPKRKKR